MLKTMAEPTRAMRLRKNIRAHWHLYLMVLPALVYVLVFLYGPMYGVQLAFKDFSAMKGVWGSEWIGFDNFSRFFKGYNFWPLIGNTFGISLYQLLIGFPAPIILALLLNEIRSVKYKKVIQMVTYAPHFISVVVIVGMLNAFFSTRTGIVNLAMTSLGMDEIPFMASNDTFKNMYVWSGVWQSVGWGSIIYIATLAGVDLELHEAAMIDGANKLQRIWHINIPAIMPTMVILLIMQCGRMMNIGFEKIFLMQNPLNMQASDVISTYVYRVGLVNSDFSFSTAVGLFNSVINCILLLGVNRISKAISSTSLF